MVLREWLSTYADARDIRPGTIDQYGWVIRSLEKFLGRLATQEDLTPETINRWLREIGERLSPYTVTSRRRQILVLWRSLSDEGQCPPPPRQIRRPKLPERIVRTLDATGVLALLGQVRSLPGTLGGRSRAGYLETLILATCDSALRQSDLHRLEWSEVRESRGRLQLIQQKTGRRRWVIFSDHTLDAMGRYMEGQSGLLWPRVERTAVTREIRAAAMAAGLGKVTHTDLRRSAIRSVEEQQPGSGWIFAGHESDQTTRKWYLPKDLQYQNLPRPTLSGRDEKILREP
jgi:integrase